MWGTCGVGGSKIKGRAMVVWCFPVFTLSFPAFFSVKHLVVRCVSGVLAIAWTTWLCQLVWKLFMCLFV